MSTLSSIFEYMVSSTYFKKWSAFFGGLALGMWLQGTYWKQIVGTLGIWGVTSSQWSGFLWAVVGAAGISTSIGLSVVKSRREKNDTAPTLAP